MEGALDSWRGVQSQAGERAGCGQGRAWGQALATFKGRSLEGAVPEGGPPPKQVPLLKARKELRRAWGPRSGRRRRKQGGPQTCPWGLTTRTPAAPQQQAGLAKWGKKNTAKAAHPSQCAQNKHGLDPTYERVLKRKL